MKCGKYILTIIIIQLLITRCSNFDNLGDGFSLQCRDSKYLCNVYFGDFGIFRNPVYEVWYNDSYILVRSHKDSTSYFLLDKRKYITKPWQLESGAIFEIKNEQMLYTKYGIRIRDFEYSKTSY